MESKNITPVAPAEPEDNLGSNPALELLDLSNKPAQVGTSHDEPRPIRQACVGNSSQGVEHASPKCEITADNSLPVDNSAFSDCEGTSNKSPNNDVTLNAFLKRDITDHASPDGETTNHVLTECEVTNHVSPNANTVSASRECVVTVQVSPDCEVTDHASPEYDVTDPELPNETSANASPDCKDTAHVLSDSESIVTFSADCESIVKAPLDCERSINASTNYENTSPVSSCDQVVADSCSMPPPRCPPVVPIKKEAPTIDPAFSEPSISGNPNHAPMDCESTQADGASTSGISAPIPCAAPPSGRLPTDAFNLSSQEGQAHLRELNEELQALNEQGSPKLSMLHLGSNARTKRRRRKRRHHDQQQRGPQSESSPRQAESDQAASSSGATATTNPRKMSKHHRVKRRLLDGELVGHDSPSPKRLSIVGESESDDEMDEDDSDEAGIMEKANNEIDRILEEKAWKANLSAVNVKNILRYVITNENVLAMVHNSMRSDGDSLEGAFEPKLTRSKAKELMEKRAKVPWPISPLKQPTPSKSKNLSELQFADSSSDEEYRPELGEISEEEDSFISTSSPIGKAESPGRDVALDLTAPSPSVETGEDVAQEGLLTQPSLLPKELDPEESDGTIALRTRSKLPLNDTPLETIEANFVAPDITTDMYDSELDDDEWKDFLGRFFKPLDPNPGEDETNEDPEYNFLEEDDTPDREDLRNDKAVRVTKKELHELMAELIEEAESATAEAEECPLARDSPTIHESAPSDTCKPREFVRYTDPNCMDDVDDGSQLFNSFRRLQLEEQMRMHVQLLAQMFVLASSQEELADARDTSKSFLVELQCLAANNASLFQRPSSFQSHNLAGAVLLADSFVEPLRATKLPQRVRLHPLTAEEKMAISESPVFLYPHLLPAGGFRVANSTKDTFTPAEDSLLAMGLEQFAPLEGRSHWELIREHMLPVKSVSSLACRAKNRRSKASPDNPVKHYYSFKCAPPISVRLRPFSPETVVVPRLQPQELLPAWLQKPVRRGPEERSKRPVTSEPRLLLPNILPCVQPPLVVAVPSSPKVEEKVAIPVKEETAEGPAPFMGNALNDMVVGPSAGFRTPQKYPATSPTGCSTPTSSSSCSPAMLTVASGNRFLSMPQLAFGTPSPRPSPLKQVSPILRKYSPKLMKKTGGNLPLAQRPLMRILPKIKIASPGPRPIAPKVALQLPQVTSTTPSKVAASATKVVEPSIEVMDCVSPPRLDHDKCDARGSEVGSEMDIDIVDPPKKSLADETENVEEMEAVVACHSPPSDDVDGFDLSAVGDPEAQANDTQESDSEPEPDNFDEGDDDTADDDVLDTLPDNEDDLAALMAASTTITATTHRNASGSRHHRSQHSMSARKSKNQRNVHKAVLAMMLAEEDPLHQERDPAFAQAYLQRVREAAGADGQLYEDFLRHLHEFQEQGDMDVVALYRDVCTILKDHQELCDEFVAFLLPEQAMRCGKFVEFLSLTRMQVFLRKLEVHFGKNPQHIHKIVRTLAHVQQLQPQPTMDDLKAAILPLLRGQQHLVEEFLQLFPHEAPTENRMTEFEEVVVPEDDGPIEVDEDGFEVLELPDRLVDSYGGPNCICRCHAASVEKSVIGSTAAAPAKNWLKHCVGCGIRFIDGRVYQQTGKALKLCHVVYLPAKSGGGDGRGIGRSPRSVPAEMASPTTGDHHLASPSSSVSSLSPPVSKDSEDERDGLMGSGCRKMAELGGEPDQSDSKSPSSSSLDRSAGDAVSSSDSMTKRETPSHYHSPIENEDVITRISEIKRSKPRRSLNFTSAVVGAGCTHRLRPAELASEDVAVDAEDASPVVGTVSGSLSSGFDIAPPQSPTEGDAPVLSIPESPNDGSAATLEVLTKNLIAGGCEDSIVVWTREHDRVLLQTCQQLGPSPDTFLTVSSVLPGKSVHQVATRFQELMTLFGRPITATITNPDDVIDVGGSNDPSGEVPCSSRSDDPPRNTPRPTKPAEGKAGAGNSDDVEDESVANAESTNDSSKPLSTLKSEPCPATTSSKQRFVSSETSKTSVLALPGTSDGSGSKMPVLAQSRIVDDKGEVAITVTPIVVVWTKEHDRVLLQTCQQLGTGRATFSTVSTMLKDKSVEEVASRFQELMNLFSKQSTRGSKRSTPDGAASTRTEES